MTASGRRVIQLGAPTYPQAEVSFVVGDRRAAVDRGDAVAVISHLLIAPVRATSGLGWSDDTMPWTTRPNAASVTNTAIPGGPAGTGRPNATQSP